MTALPAPTVLRDMVSAIVEDRDEVSPEWVAGKVHDRYGVYVSSKLISHHLVGIGYWKLKSNDGDTVRIIHRRIPDVPSWRDIGTHLDSGSRRTIDAFQLAGIARLWVAVGWLIALALGYSLGKLL